MSLLARNTLQTSERRTMNVDLVRKAVVALAESIIRGMVASAACLLGSSRWNPRKNAEWRGELR